jgi:hypothetical protein
VRKLRAALPEVRILVGRWAPPEMADEDRSTLVDAGAAHVATTLIETRNELRTLAVHERQRSRSVSLDSTAPKATKKEDSKLENLSVSV